METSSAPGALPPAVPGVPAPIAIRGDAAGFSQRRISSSSPAGNVGFVAGVIARSGGRVFGVLCSLEAEVAGELVAEGAVLSPAGDLGPGGAEPLAEGHATG